MSNRVFALNSFVLLIHKVVSVHAPLPSPCSDGLLFNTNYRLIICILNCKSFQALFRGRFPIKIFVFYYAAINPGLTISFISLSRSYSTPFVSITKNTLITLQHNATFDCFPFNGFFCLVV